MIKRTAAVIMTGILMLMGCGGRQEDKTETYAIYEEFVWENFAENPTRQILADLDGDEKEEMILLADQTAADDPDNFQGTLKVFGISPGGQVNERYSTDVAENTAGWRWMYLYQREGETPAILEYSPQISAGMGPVILRFICFSEEEWFYEEIDSFFWDSLHTSGREREQMEQKKEEFAGTLEEYTRWALPLVMLGQDTAVTGESSAYFGGLPVAAKIIQPYFSRCGSTEFPLIHTCNPSFRG